MSQRRRTTLILLALLGLALLSRGPAVWDKYINLDDPLLLTKNDVLLHGLSFEGFRFAFTDLQAANWTPLTFISYMVDTQLFGPGPMGPHLTNVLLHAGSVLVLFLMLRAMTGAVWRSAGAAALLAVHPIHTESIAWIAERRDVLSLLLGLLSLWAYALYARPAGTGRHYAMSLLAFGASLMAKPMLVTLPCVMLLLDYWPLGRMKPGAWRLILEKLPFLAASAAVSVLTYVAQSHAMHELSQVSLAVRWVNIPVGYGWYLYRLVWPTELPVFYPYRLVWPVGVMLAAPTALAVISLFAFLQRRRRPWLLVGWLWFLGALVPVIGLVQVGHAAFASRYAYFPFIGLYIAIAWTAGQWAISRPRRVAVGVATAAAVVVLAGLSMVEARRWRDTYTLFTYAASVTPESVMVDDNLAAAMHELAEKDPRQDQEAMAYWRRAMVLEPSDPVSACILANYQLMAGRPAAAATLIRQAQQMHPDSDRVLAVSGMILLGQHRVAAAVADLRRACQTAEGNALYRHDLSLAFEAAGQMGDAIKAEAEAVARAPDGGEYWSRQGLLLLMTGKPADAVVKLTRATRLQPEDVNTWFNLGQALMACNRLADSLPALRQAVALAPHSPEAHFELGVALGRSGQTRDAAEEFRRVLKLDPSNKDAAENLRQATLLLNAPRPGGDNP